MQQQKILLQNIRTNKSESSKGFDEKRIRIHLDGVAQIQVRIRNLCYDASTFAVICARGRKSRLKKIAKIEKS